MIRRYGPLAVLLAVLIAAWAGGVTHELSLDALRRHHEGLRLFVAGHLALSLAAYIGLYALAAAVGLPGVALLTLAGGLLFGPWLGGSAAALGATAGAVVLFSAARSALGETLRRRAAEKGGLLQKVMDGAQHHAFISIFTLRLMPIAPFWLVNLAAGIAHAPLRAFLPATALGILPVTFAFSVIGASLESAFARGDHIDLHSLASPRILLALCALALLSLAPIAVRGLRRAGRG